MTILFACTHNAGRSQMAAAWCRHLAGDRLRVVSAGTSPVAAVHEGVRIAMREKGIDLTGVVPQRLTVDVAAGADVLVTMGCGESCPVVPGARHVDWAVVDPKDQPLDRVRAIRDEIEDLVRALIADLGSAAAGSP